MRVRKALVMAFLLVPSVSARSRSDNLIKLFRRSSSPFYSTRHSTAEILIAQQTNFTIFYFAMLGSFSPSPAYHASASRFNDV
jgi:hypothetical protein